MKSLLSLLPLLAVACFSGCDREPAPLFHRLPAAGSGLTFANRIVENDTFNILDFEYVYNGGGVGAGDFNGDGLTDLYFTGNMVSNRLYLNLGDLQFLDVTEMTGTGGRGRWCSGINVSDVNGDGHLDLYVSATIYEPGARRANLLYLNEGTTELRDGVEVPRFREVALACGIADTSHTTQSAFFDYDRDGDLDLYLLVNEMDDRNIPNRYLPKRTDGSGRRNDILYRNDGNDAAGLPRFTNVTREAGILKDGYGLGLAICDPNDDGWPDVFVTNDYLSNDLLWINNGDGTFTDRADDYFKHSAYSAMGNDVADLNNDGLDDIVALDMYPEDNARRKAMMPPNNYNAILNNERFGYLPQFTRNVLQLNAGPRPDRDAHLFADVGMQAGIAATDWSWSPLAADFDHDGDRDLLITNGFPRDVTDRDFMDYNVVVSKLASWRMRIDQIPTVKIANYAYENDGAEVPEFRKRTREWGLEEPSFSNGAAYADLDNDGDLDYVVNNINDSCFLYRNDLVASDSTAWLRVRPRGTGGNTAALGARVTVHLSDGRRRTAFHHPVRGFLSSVADDLHFGFGPADSLVGLDIRWPDGRREHFPPPPLNQVFSPAAGEGRPVAAPAPAPTPLLRALPDFASVFSRHRDSLFIDFNVQPLLPHKLSEFGPGLAVGDVNGDGRDDLFRTGSHFFAGELALQRADGTFSRSTAVGEDTDREGLGALFFDADGDGDQDLYIANGGSEYAAGRPELHDQLLLNDGRGSFTAAEGALPRTGSSASCVRAADYDRDGDLDLFVGGRLLPAAFPQPVDSYVLNNDGNGRFTPAAVPELRGIGLVCDALWTDYDADGWVDLLVAGQGMGLRLFANAGGTFSDATPAEFLDHVGWWNGLSSGDFDRDGDLDYVATNFGQNHLYRAGGADFVGLYGGDFDGNGGYDLLVADRALAEDGSYREFPHAQRTDTEKQLISVKQRFPRHADFGRATIQEVLDGYPNVQVTALRANYLRSVWIENRGDGSFRFRALPRAAQSAPLYGTRVADLNGDAYPDLLAIGNDYGGETGAGPLDALNGVALVFDPALGDFRLLPPTHHELFVPGNGRSLAAVLTPAGPVLVAAENNGPTRAFRAPLAGRYLTVGPRVQRVTFRTAAGPTVAEVYYGSGYLGQESRAVWLPTGATDVRTIDFDGSEGVPSR